MLLTVLENTYMKSKLGICLVHMSIASTQGVEVVTVSSVPLAEVFLNA